MKVLIVEDEDSIAEPLARGLEREGFQVARVATGGDALRAAAPDFILLDLGRPYMEGFAVCRERRARARVPVIMVTAKGEELDRVLGLELGADDYIVKPFGFRELVARIRAVTRRTSVRPDDRGSLHAGALSIDVRTRRARLGERELELTLKEFDLLALLASDPGTVFSRQRILEAVWDTHWYGHTKTIDVHVAALRRKLGDPRWIETVRGVGFRLVEPG